MPALLTLFGFGLFAAGVAFGTFISHFHYRDRRDYGDDGVV
jgi:hypothetical protein